MKKAFALWGFVFLTLLSCSDEDPLLTEVQKVVEVNMEYSANRTSSDGNFELTETTDIVSDEFAEYVNQIRDFEVNEISIEMHGLDTMPGQPSLRFEHLAVSLHSLEAGGPSVQMFELTNVTIATQGTRLVIYRKDVPPGSELFNAVNFVRSRLLREQAFSWELQAETDGLRAGGHIDIKLELDLTAEVILP